MCCLTHVFCRLNYIFFGYMIYQPYSSKNRHKRNATKHKFIVTYARILLCETLLKLFIMK